MAKKQRKKEKRGEGTAEWLLTYGDTVTLLLTFFVMMFTTTEEMGGDIRIMLAAFQGLGVMEGGNTLSKGKLAELGNVVMSLPSSDQGRALDKSLKLARSIFEPDIKTQKTRIKEDERGLIISLASDAFFKVGSAEVNIESTRDNLQRIASFLSSSEFKNNKFRIEGHTDNIPTDKDSPFMTNWELSTARSTNVLHYLVDFGVNEKQFQVSGFADTVPLYNNNNPETRALNRRVDIVVITEGHL